jgi:hypothetical protein
MTNLNGWISIHDQLPPASARNPQYSAIINWCDMTNNGVEANGLMKDGFPKNRHHSGYFVYKRSNVPAHFQNGGLGINQFAYNPDTKEFDIPQALFWRMPDPLPEL